MYTSHGGCISLYPVTNTYPIPQQSEMSIHFALVQMVFLILAGFFSDEGPTEQNQKEKQTYEALILYHFALVLLLADAGCEAQRHTCELSS